MFMCIYSMYQSPYYRSKVCSNHHITGTQCVPNTLLQVYSVFQSPYYKLTQDVPATKPLFANVRSLAHAFRAVVGFDLCLNALQDIHALEELKSHLARQHAARVEVNVAYLDVSWLFCSMV